MAEHLAGQDVLRLELDHALRVPVSQVRDLDLVPHVIDLHTLARREPDARTVCGAAPAENFALVAPHTRLFLFDVKHAEEEKLRAVTGADIAEVGANLSFAAARTEVIARVPVIPCFNHTEAEMEGIFCFALSHGVRRVDLLPYHTLGRGKYAKLGREYALDAAMLTKEDLLPWKALGESLGLDVGIGG